MSDERSVRRHGPLELHLSRVFVERNTGHPYARPHRRYSSQYAERGVQSSVQPPTVAKFSDWVLRAKQGSNRQEDRHIGGSQGRAKTLIHRTSEQAHGRVARKGGYIRTSNTSRSRQSHSAHVIQMLQIILVRDRPIPEGQDHETGI